MINSFASTLHSSAKSAVKATTAAASNIMYGKEKDYTWDELTTIEKNRRDILKRTEEPFWEILTHYRGTVLPIMLKDTLFWITLLIYIGIRVWARIGLPDYVADLGSGDIAVIGGFLSFFLVFYVNQSNTRFFDLYNKAMACKGRIIDTATIVTAALPPVPATRIIRYMNASYCAGYTGLSKTYPASSFFAQQNKNFGLVTDQELKRLQEIDLDKGGSCMRECLAWAMNDVQNLYKQGLIDAELANQIRDMILRLRAEFSGLFNAADLPIPFFYVHFICLLSALYLPLFAISAAYQAGTGTDVHWAADIVAGLVVVLQSLFVIGLRILGQKMNDPFGDDDVDLSVIWYSTFTWRMSNRVLNAQLPREEPSELVEKTLIRNRQDSIGNAFERDESFHTVITDDDDATEDVNGFSINQLQDGSHGPKSRFWFQREG